MKAKVIKHKKIVVTRVLDEIRLHVAPESYYKLSPQQAVMLGEMLIEQAAVAESYNRDANPQQSVECRDTNESEDTDV